ncbi:MULTISPECIES: polysaccharide biosynthesis tyrosine autokinase [unclassified Fibrobacter]|uniref:polysaccharide biosynthesis tyrosine autokinase n=1 Tax=unclassified Fibrobacter TaxID=2634177 RepID=UPI000D6BBDD8|nr:MULTISPECIES: polysaccharide biosynthesis tyrosine autokinase [unclassified Fibrobacter]PWJ58614.1 tyrosine-protein kinase Etk/Wzc [Fibrobacter sp. UWR4]PZW62844.1 tyrosine-protein kinase Etk/Wzc [Fibrobacter sp. UWR1]
MASTSKKEETDILDLFKELLNNWKIMIPCIFLAGVVGVIVAMWIRPIYQVDALLQIENKNSKGPAASMMGGLASLFASASPAETEIELINSRQVIGDAVEKMHLQYVATPTNKLDRLLHKEGRMELNQFIVPGNVMPKEEKHDPWIAKVIDSTTFEVYDHNHQKVVTSGKVSQTYHIPYGQDTVVLSVYRMIARAGQEFELSQVERLESIEAFKHAFGVKERGKKTGILEFSYQDIYPDRATEVLNEIATNYLRQNVEQRNAEAQKTLEFLEKQLPEVKAQMDSSLLKFNTYRNRVGSVDINAETRIVLEKRAKLQQDLLSLQQKKQDAIRLFQPEHPTVKTLEEQENALKRELSTNSSEARRLPATQQEVLKLTNEVDMSKIMYTSMLNNIQQLKLVSAGEVGSVRIIDFAEPVNKPTKPKKKIILLVALFIGFLVGATIVSIKSKLSSGVKDANFIERETGYSVYAKVPKGNPNGTKGTRPLAVVEPDDVAVESLRALRSSLEFSMDDTMRQIIGVSGLIPGVGKSFISVNLAALYAGLGKRVLLIDADLRKGRLHKEFGLSRDKGLSQILLGEINAQDVTYETEVENLYVMPCGKSPTNPSEILGSKHYAELIESLEKQFDLIIVDTPPIMLVTDAALACRFASQVVMVIEYNKHSINAIKDGMAHLLKGNNSAHASFVINKYEHSHADGYGYKYGKY